MDICFVLTGIISRDYGDYGPTLEEECCLYFDFDISGTFFINVCCPECNCGVPTDAGRQCQTVNCADVEAFADINAKDEDYGPCPANLCGEISLYIYI